MSVEIKDKYKHTFFQKGNLPHNTLHDGATTIRYNKNGVPYEFVRVSLSNWVTKKNVIWEQHNGAIPKGYVVRCKDGNSMNSAIENLELISRIENMRRNTIHNYPEEIKQVIRINSKLKKAINEKQTK